MRIMICDENLVDLRKIKRVVKNFLTANVCEPCEVLAYSKPFDLLDRIDKDGAPDVCLLEVEMKGILGTEIAAIINRLSQETTDIIFVTAKDDYAVEAFNLHAFDYVKKPFTDHKLFSTLKRLFSKKNISKYVIVSSKNETFRIDLLDIVYIETLKNSIEIHLKNGNSIVTNITLKRFVDNFEGVSGFIKVGASYFVNIRYVTIFHKTTIEMTNGDLISVPRRLKVEIKDEFYSFYKKEAI